MKNYVFLLLILWSFGAIGQQSYYNDVNLTLTGTALKNELAAKITNTHTNILTYTPDIWEASRITDEDPDNSNNVILLYGWEDGTDGDVTNDRSRSKTANGGNVGDWNREHSYPQSLGNPPLGTEGPGADAHHLRPTDVQRNGNRGSRLFAAGSGNSGTVGSNWYPGDEWKGDIARMMMYMYLRYGDRCLPSAVGVGNNSATPDDMIDLFLQWNADDPVSVIEDNRNNYHDSNDTYAQGNRNPFIDNPRLATLIWGGPVAEDRWGIFDTDNEAPSVPTNLMIGNETSSSIDLSWTASTDNVGVTGYDIYVDGGFNKSVITTNTTVTGLSSETTYVFTVLAKDAAGNNSAQSSSINGTTIASSGNTNELFISEYIEGSSLNKALEIANFTGNTVLLDPYELRLSANGNADWTTATYSFPNGSFINNGDVFVIIHGSFALTCSNVSATNDTNSSITAFNGNDAIGLFKNNTLIDILGQLGNNSTYGENVTLVRKETVTSPNITYDFNEWNSLGSNNCDDLGRHTSNVLSIRDNDLSEINIYPNPSKGNIFIETPNISEKLEIKVFDITGKLILITDLEKTKRNTMLLDLPKGMLLLELSSSKMSVIKKIIVQ